MLPANGPPSIGQIPADLARPMRRSREAKYEETAGVGSPFVSDIHEGPPTGCFGHQPLCDLAGHVASLG
jgi:hypothetical protein